MKAETAYQFLQSPLDQMTLEEKRKLCKLIMSPEDEPEIKKKRKKIDNIPSVAFYKKKLLATIFKK